LNAGVKTRSAPSTGSNRTRDVGVMGRRYGAVFAWRPRTVNGRMALSMASPRRFRGLGKGRKIRRTLDHGGIGLAARLNRTLGAWDGVRIKPMFGRWGYFAGERLFACFPLARKERDLWIRLAPDDQRRALREPGVRPHRRFARRGWVELDLADDADVPRALRWLRRAHAADLPAEEPD